MASLLSGEPEANYRPSQERPEEGGGRWYLSRRELEEDSPSRRDGIDLKKETYFRKSYCTFLQDLGMRLKVPQVTIATAIIFCHRFFLRQSHAKNDRRTIATVCMFLAGKVEETPRPLKDVILVSYEIIHKKDAAAVQRIKQKEVYEQQKELILLGERVVLGTLGFDLNLHHPYKPLVEAIKKFKVAQNALAQVAWNFVNDGLRTSLCLQFKPHHIAAGAIFLAAKFLKVKLPSDGEKVWWQEFDVTPRQLEEVSNQMLELYEQNRVPPASQASEAEGSVGPTQRPPAPKAPSNEEQQYSSSHGGQHNTDDNNNNNNNHVGPPRTSQSRNNNNNSDDYENSEIDCTPGRNDEINEMRTEDNNYERNEPVRNSSVSQSPKKLDKEKLKAAFERRKARGDITRKVDPMDELERELEDVEMPGEKKQSKLGDDLDAVEEGELELSDEVDRGGYRSPKSSVKKRKPGSPLDRNGLGRQVGYSEREHKRHLQENHV
ncbi:cyclin-t1-3 [Phtheirospermum japonicum]|uniref:Cyclin-t1-3 n=1 Tax=Phtheirospermum japonicum TaxID=374723 RepID=A0A830DIU3_9LAMI|nr:cyclin-t1-3 [Phtheirospermum japonicum]